MSDPDAAVAAAETCIKLLERGAPIGSEQLQIIAEAWGHDAAPFRRRPKSGYVFEDSPARIIVLLSAFIRNTRASAGTRGHGRTCSMPSARR
jgi:hypothetical protein